jgi:hypothetical protein
MIDHFKEVFMKCAEEKEKSNPLKYLLPIVTGTLAGRGLHSLTKGRLTNTPGSAMALGGSIGTMYSMGAKHKEEVDQMLNKANISEEKKKEILDKAVLGKKRGELAPSIGIGAAGFGLGALLGGGLAKVLKKNVMDGAEIGSLIGMTPSAVYSIFNKHKKRVKEELGEKND